MPEWTSVHSYYSTESQHCWIEAEHCQVATDSDSSNLYHQALQMQQNLGHYQAATAYFASISYPEAKQTNSNSIASLGLQDVQTNQANQTSSDSVADSEHQVGQTNLDSTAVQNFVAEQNFVAKKISATTRTTVGQN